MAPVRSGQAPAATVVYPFITMLPVTIPDSVNCGVISEMVHVTELGAEPFVALDEKDGPPVGVKVRFNVVGTKIPVAPESNAKWATFQVCAACELPLFTVNVPITPPGQVKVPV
jgi:hypothetical protein